MEWEKQPRPFGLTDFDEKALFHFQKLKESLEWKDGKPPDPYKVHQALAHIALEVGYHKVPSQTYRREGPPDREAFTENMDNVRDAFGLVASPSMNEYGKLAMDSLYGWRKGELSITPQQKRMLTMITTAAGIPDDPNRLTYPYSMASRPSVSGNGQGKLRR